MFCWEFLACSTTGRTVSAAINKNAIEILFARTGRPQLIACSPVFPPECPAFLGTWPEAAAASGHSMDFVRSPDVTRRWPNPVQLIFHDSWPSAVNWNCQAALSSRIRAFRWRWHKPAPHVPPGQVLSLSAAGLRLSRFASGDGYRNIRPKLPARLSTHLPLPPAKTRRWDATKKTNRAMSRELAENLPV